MMIKKPIIDEANAFSQAARRAVIKAGWSANYDLEILGSNRSSPAQSVRYGYRADKVRLQDSPDLPRQVEKAATFLNLPNLGEPQELLYDLVATRVFLQIGGYNVCPYSVSDYYEILEACADGLRSAGANEVDVHKFTIPATSFFIAAVVAGVYGIEGPGPATFRRGFPLDHIVASINKNSSLPAYSALYANVLMRLWSDDPELATALRRFYPSPFDTLEFETDRGIAILVDSYEYVGHTKDGLAWLNNGRTGQDVVSELKYRWRQWPLKGFQWAEMLAPYLIDHLDSQRPPQQPPTTDNNDERPSDRASERRRSVSPTNVSRPQEFLDNSEEPWIVIPQTPEDPFGTRMADDPQFRELVMQAGIGHGKNPLDIFFSFDTLNTLYRSRIAEVNIESQHTRKRANQFEIGHLTNEKIDSATPSLNHIDWGATRMDSNKKLTLFTKQIPVTDNIPGAMEVWGLDDLLFIVDSSGSMIFDPKAGAGQYDSLVRAVYSVFDFLEQEKKGQHMRFAMVNFSGTTLRTPWVGFSELRKIKELLFRHQRGGTVLDCDVLQQVIDDSSDRFLCLMITDAAISNANAAMTAIRKMQNQGHGFVLLQIGKPSALSKEVEKIGLPVHIIAQHQKLKGLCLKYANKTWKGRKS